MIHLLVIVHADALPDDAGLLKAMLIAERIESERLRQIIREFQRHRFGRRAESLPEDRPSSELAEPLDRPMARRILAQGQMRSEFVVIAGVGRKDPAQMGLAEDDDVIEAFPADRADQSLRMPVLPG